MEEFEIAINIRLNKVYEIDQIGEMFQFPLSMIISTYMSHESNLQLLEFEIKFL